MDVADQLIEKIFSWVELEKKCAKKMNKLATELEKTKKNCNVTKVVGSSVSVGGAAVIAVSGIAALLTGGLAIPFLFAGGAVVSALGLTTNVVTDVTDMILSKKTMKEATAIGKKIENLEKGIFKLMETLKKEGKRREKLAPELSPEDYVTERILRALAKREGLILNDAVSLRGMLSALSKSVTNKKGTDFALLGFSLVSKVIMIAIRKSGKSLVSNGFPKLAMSMGLNAAGNAVGRIGAGAVGLAFSVPELVINCIRVNKCETEASKSLRKNAEDILNASQQLEEELKEIQKLFKRLANIKACIEKQERSRDDRQKLMEFAKEHCKDEAVQQWLIQNETSDIFSRLVEMFQFLKEKIDEEEEKNHSNTVDITFVAHGAITDSMMSAACLLPLPTVTDVVLYSPWNCYLSATAAYGIATGKIQPQHRVFICGEDGCKVPDRQHRPSELPNEWNSMKKAGNQQIPNIIVSPLKLPEDGAWNRFEVLEENHGKPGRNRIVVPFILQEGSKGSSCIPLPVVTLALSLVLMFSRFQATLHLTACLGKLPEENKLNNDSLKRQYACTVDKTGMTSSLKMLYKWPKLHQAFKALFG